MSSQLTSSIQIGDIRRNMLPTIPTSPARPSTPERGIVITSGEMKVFVCCIFVAAKKEVTFNVAILEDYRISSVPIHFVNPESVKQWIFEQEALSGIRNQ